MTPPRIDFLFVRLGALGDVLRALPFVRAFAKENPEKRMGFLTQELSLPVIQGIPEISMPLLFPRKAFVAGGPLGWIQAVRWARSKKQWLRESGSPRVIDLHGTYKSALISRLIAPDGLIGFPRRETKEPVQWLYPEKFSLPEIIPSRFARYEAAFRELGVKGNGLTGLPLAEKYRDAGARAAEAAGGKLAVLVVGTSHKEAYKRWPAARFGELAQRLKSELGLAPVIAWGPGEESLRDAALAAAGNSAAALPLLPLLELFGLMQHAALVVSCDTGPLHAAALQGRPGVAIFGATDATLNQPWGNSFVVVKGNPEPWKKGYRGQEKWMEAVTVETVMAAAQKAIMKPPSGA